MYDVVSETILAERQRQLGWVNEHAWKYERLRAAPRPIRAGIARAILAVAARIAPVTERTTAEPAAQQ